jgi:hypothetical protein
MVGGITIGLNVVIVLLTGFIWLGFKHSISRFTVKSFLIFVFFFIFSLIVALIGPCEDKLLKGMMTAPVLLLLICLGLEIGWRARVEDWLQLHNTSSWILLTAFFLIILEILLPQLFPLKAKYQIYGLYSGIYSEPSHVAFSLFPSIIILFSAKSRSHNIIGVLSLLFLFIYSRSSSLIIFTIFLIAYYIIMTNMRQRVLLICAGSLLFCTFLFTTNYRDFFKPTIDRFEGITAVKDTSSSKNISSLVFVQGYEDAFSNFMRTNGLGLGINMMGCNPLPESNARYLLLSAFRTELNSEDGSFIFSKLISEWGVVGLIFFILLIWGWIDFKIQIKKLGNKYLANVGSVQSLVIFSFIVVSFVRSVGYFSCNFMLLVVAAAGAAKWCKSNRLNLSKDTRLAK